MVILKLLALRANAIKVKSLNIKRKGHFFMYLIGKITYVRLKESEGEKEKNRRRRSSELRYFKIQPYQVTWVKPFC